MKHLIKKSNNIAHGTIAWSHKGNDGQYCEAGETVKIKWQPDAGWGLQEIHYTPEGSGPVTIEGGEFTMPDSAVVIGATFKKFVVQDWTGVGKKGEAMMVGDNGEPIPNSNVTMSEDGRVTAKGDVLVGGNLILLDKVDSSMYRLYISNGTLKVRAI